MDPGVPTHGWQFFAAQASERHFRTEVLWPRLDTPGSHAFAIGPFAGLPFLAVPSSPFSRFPPRLFRVLLLRRLWLPLPLSSRTCRCGHLLDVLGHHRAACSRVGVLANRGFSVESAAARVCREASARVSTNLFVRNLDLPVARHDGRRLEIEATVSPGVSALTWTALLSPKPVVSGSALVQSSRAIMAAPGWLFLQLRLERSALCTSNPLRSSTAGMASPLVVHACMPVHVHLPCLCWTVGLLWVAMENLHPRPLW